MNNFSPTSKTTGAGLVENLKKHDEQLEEEYELLLLQLHQVQEELERYYLLNQQNEKRLVELSELGKSTPSTAKEEQARLAAERQQQIDTVTQARDAQAKLASERQGQLEQAIKAKEEQSRLAAERQQQIDKLIKARDEQAKLVQAKQTEIVKLKIIFQEGQARAARLESQLAEMGTRQRMINEEMIKAEVQIDLIKDVLLHEAGV